VTVTPELKSKNAFPSKIYVTSLALTEVLVYQECIERNGRIETIPRKVGRSTNRDPHFGPHFLSNFRPKVHWKDAFLAGQILNAFGLNSNGMRCGVLK
jgi:hypothetical protein